VPSYALSLFKTYYTIVDANYYHCVEDRLIALFLLQEITAWRCIDLVRCKGWR